MLDLIDTLAAEGGKDLVQALVKGLVQLAGKIPALWRHAGPETEAQMAKEVELTAEKVRAAGPDRDQAVMEAQIEWKTRLRDLLRRYPEVRSELEDLLSELQRKLPTVVQHTQIQNVTTHHGSAFAALNGNVINHYYDRSGRRLPDVPGDGAEPDELP